jgi:hypothetical protein
VDEGGGKLESICLEGARRRVLVSYASSCDGRCDEVKMGVKESDTSRKLKTERLTIFFLFWSQRFER